MLNICPCAVVQSNSYMSVQRKCFPECYYGSTDLLLPSVSPSIYQSACIHHHAVILTW